MRLLIDLQGAQGLNSQRGIGRYSLALTKALLHQANNHEILLALNGQFPAEVNHIRQQFDTLIPQENIHIWQTPALLKGMNKQHDWRRKAAERMRESFLASLNPDIVHVCSLFEGLWDHAVTSIGIQEPNLLTSVTLYDLIPLIRPKDYLINPIFNDWYQQKLKHLKRSDLYLAISEASRQEGMEYLSLPKDAIINISTAADKQFTLVDVDIQTKQSLLHRYGLTKPFILYTGGMDPRKNIHGLIRAFSLLPTSLRRSYQLVIVCHMPADKKSALNAFIKSQKLTTQEVILTNYVSEKELIILYNLCDLFVFPSLHEGFGLPVLEAMSCGAAVIGSNIPSISEVIDREDALFDPHNDAEIAHKIQQVLTDASFRRSLKLYALEQSRKFSWNNSAKRAIEAFEALHEKHQQTQKTLSKKWIYAKRPKLAYISPLPPVQTGIADYSAALLPELSRYYDIDVIVNQTDVKDSWITANCSIHPISFFKENSHQYDRVLYQFGNSLFHHHMFSLIEEYPGVVVLHDFFLSSIISHMDLHHMKPGYWAEALYQSHGYQAVQARFHASDTADIVYQYPCNLAVLEAADGIIVHSEYAHTLAQDWYEKKCTDHWKKIPLLRKPSLRTNDKSSIKKLLGFSADDFIVCSFGFLGASKLNHRLLHAWLSSELSQQKNCHLIFVGENAQGQYGMTFATSIKKHTNIHITGFIISEKFSEYLSMTDVAVQLRSHSRGETSAAVLDCMNHGIPIIINANGALAELPQDCVYMLPDTFEDETLLTALETLWKNKMHRDTLSEKAKNYIALHHSPHHIGKQYHETIETYYVGTASSKTRLLTSLSSSNIIPDIQTNWLEFSEMIGANHSARAFRQKQIYIDISKLIQKDDKTGIQRVTRGILKELFLNPPKGYRIEPIYASLNHEYYYAREYTLKFLDCPNHILEDRLIEPKSGDIFLGLDLEPHVVPHHHDYFQTLRTQGVKVFFMVYDMIPFLQPQYFPPIAKQDLHKWLKTISCTDGLLCISHSVAKDVCDWVETYPTDRTHRLDIGWFHLGADFEKTNTSKGLPQNFDKDLQKISESTTILMVSTIEPRKGYAQALSAFELLWKDNQSVNLVIVGKQGWMVEDLIERLNHHSEKGKRLFWYPDGSDELLLTLYRSAKGVLIAANAEGFGLTTIEAAQHKKPILLRDIPVFKEVAGEHATYFPDDDSPEVLAHSLKKWLNALASGEAIASDTMPYLTWADCTQQVVSLLLDKHHSHWIYQHQRETQP